MRLGFGEAILIASLVALGWVTVGDQRAENRSNLVGMLRRERQLREEVGQLRQVQRTLKKQASALTNDPYFVERTVREEFGWRPIRDAESLRQPAEQLAAMAADAVRPRPPLTDSGDGAPEGVPLPTPLAPPPDQAGRELLAMLGYGSAMDFQRKMMSGNATGVLDDTTVARANGLLALLERIGCGSVRTFQEQQRLAADGILGKHTEQRLRQVARDRDAREARRGRAGRSAIVIHDGPHDRTRPGG